MRIVLALVALASCLRSARAQPPGWAAAGAFWTCSFVNIVQILGSYSTCQSEEVNGGFTLSPAGGSSSSDNGVVVASATYYELNPIATSLAAVSITQACCVVCLSCECLFAPNGCPTSSPCPSPGSVMLESSGSSSSVGMNPMFGTSDSVLGSNVQFLASGSFNGYVLTSTQVGIVFNGGNAMAVYDVPPNCGWITDPPPTPSATPTVPPTPAATTSSSVSATATASATPSTTGSLTVLPAYPVVLADSAATLVSNSVLSFYSYTGCVGQPGTCYTTCLEYPSGAITFSFDGRYAAFSTGGIQHVGTCQCGLYAVIEITSSSVTFVDTLNGMSYMAAPLLTSPGVVTITFYQPPSGVECSASYNIESGSFIGASPQLPPGSSTSSLPIAAIAGGAAGGGALLIAGAVVLAIVLHRRRQRATAAKPVTAPPVTGTSFDSAALNGGGPSRRSLPLPNHLSVMWSAQTPPPQWQTQEQPQSQWPAATPQQSQCGGTMVIENPMARY
jgi:hypothetical protein